MLNLSYTVLKTRLPYPAAIAAIHFVANFTESLLPGLGVSGNTAQEIVKPVMGPQPGWLTGGSVGLEASSSGLVC